MKQYVYENLEDRNMNAYVRKRLKCAYESRKCIGELLEDGGIKESVIPADGALNELYTYIEHNTWLEYFLECPSYVSENWIDFESEISRVI